MRSAPRAGEFLNPRPPLLAPSTPVREAARLLLRTKAPGAAVVEGERRYAGIFSQQGLMLALVDTVHHELPAGPVSGYLDPPPPVLSEDTTLLTVVHVFAGFGEHRVLPVLRGERLLGTVTRLDVARVFRAWLDKAEDLRAALPYLTAGPPPATPPFPTRGERR